MQIERGIVRVPVTGVTLLAMLLVLAVLGMWTGRAAETWDSQVRHSLESELIFRGHQYKTAIEDYWAAKAWLSRSAL